MKQKDWDYIARLEKAIQEKYGRDAVINPKTNWTDEKEKAYLKQIKEDDKKEIQIKVTSERVKKDGFFFSKNLISKKSKRKCSVCITYSFDKKDDLYMNKFQCCWKCYIQWVEDREERWKKGWRPKHVEEKEKD